MSHQPTDTDIVRQRFLEREGGVTGGTAGLTGLVKRYEQLLQALNTQRSAIENNESTEESASTIQQVYQQLLLDLDITDQQISSPLTMGAEGQNTLNQPPVEVSNNRSNDDTYTKKQDNGYPIDIKHPSPPLRGSQSMVDVDHFSTQPSKPQFDRSSSTLQVGWYKTKIVASAVRRVIMPDPSAHDWLTMGRHFMVAALLIIVILLVGAAVMTTLERSSELLARDAFYQADSTLQHRLTAEEYQQVTNALNYNTLQPYFTNDKWDYKGSMFFCLTIATSIGYGNYAPATPEGKIFIIFYGTVGIICMAYSLYIIAETSLAGMVYLYGRLYPNRSTWTLRTRLIICLGFGVTLVVIGGGIFSCLEGYSYVDSAYFSWGTLLTVGLGDIVPQQSSSRTVLGVYMVVGLGIVSTLIDYVVESTAPSPRGLPVRGERSRIHPPSPLVLPAMRLRAHLGDRDEDQELTIIAGAAAEAGVARAKQAIKLAKHAAQRARLTIQAAERLEWSGWKVNDGSMNHHMTKPSTLRPAGHQKSTSSSVRADHSSLNEQYNSKTVNVAGDLVQPSVLSMAAPTTASTSVKHDQRSDTPMLLSDRALNTTSSAKSSNQRPTNNQTSCTYSQHPSSAAPGEYVFRGPRTQSSHRLPADLFDTPETGSGNLVTARTEHKAERTSDLHQS